MNRTFLLKIAPLLLIALLPISSCTCVPEPADLNGDKASMKFQLWTIGNDPEATSGQCFLLKQNIRDIEVTFGSLDANNNFVKKADTDVQVSSLSNNLEFNLQVPTTGAFAIQVRLEMDCHMCCNSFFRTGKPPGCPNKNGKPVMEGERTFQYQAGAVGLITPVMKRCRCDCP